MLVKARPASSIGSGGRQLIYKQAARRLLNNAAILHASASYLPAPGISLSDLTPLSFGSSGLLHLLSPLVYYPVVRGPFLYNEGGLFYRLPYLTRHALLRERAINCRSIHLAYWYVLHKTELRKHFCYSFDNKHKRCRTTCSATKYTSSRQNYPFYS